MWFPLSLAFGGSASTPQSALARAASLAGSAAAIEARLRDKGLSGIAEAAVLSRRLAQALSGIDERELARASLEAAALAELLAPVAETLQVLRQLKAAVDEAERRS